MPGTMTFPSMAAISLALILAGCSTTSIYDEAKRLEQEGKYGEAGDIWLQQANSNRGQSSDFNNAAKSFDRDQKRSADAFAARKLAAARAMKEAEYYESKFEYQNASHHYGSAADIYKHPWGMKDLDDISSSEHARLLEIKNFGLYLRSGKSKIGDTEIFLLSMKYDQLIKLVGSDKRKVNDYTMRRDSHVKSIRDYMPTANRLAQEREAREAEREALEEKARREKSNRDFAMALGAATTMLASAQQHRNNKPQGSSSPNYSPSSTSNNHPPSSSNSGAASATRQSGGPAQINVGSASQVTGGGNSNSSSGRNTATGNNSNSKFQSKDAKHCVEIIPKEFKGCKYKRCLYNACPEKISVSFKGGGSGWGMVHLENGRSWPVNYVGDDGSYVYFQACSWDPKAGPNYGPYVTGGCRY